MSETSHQWELCKENVQPSSHGRSAAALCEGLKDASNTHLLIRERQKVVDALIDNDAATMREKFYALYELVSFAESITTTLTDADVKRVRKRCANFVLQQNKISPKEVLTVIYNTNAWCHILFDFVYYHHFEAKVSKSVVYHDIDKMQQGKMFGSYLPFYLKWAKELMHEASFTTALEVLQIPHSRFPSLSDSDLAAIQAQKQEIMRKKLDVLVTEYATTSSNDYDVLDEPTRNCMGQLKGIRIEKGAVRAPFVRPGAPSAGLGTLSKNQQLQKQKPDTKLEVFTDPERGDMSRFAEEPKSVDLEKIVQNDLLPPKPSENSKSPGQWPAQKLSRIAHVSSSSSGASVNAFPIFTEESKKSDVQRSRKSATTKPPPVALPPKFAFPIERYQPKDGPEMQFEEYYATIYMERMKAKKQLIKTEQKRKPFGEKSAHPVKVEPSVLVVGNEPVVKKTILLPQPSVQPWPEDSPTRTRFKNEALACFSQTLQFNSFNQPNANDTVGADSVYEDDVILKNQPASAPFTVFTDENDIGSQKGPSKPAFTVFEDVEDKENTPPDDYLPPQQRRPASCAVLQPSSDIVVDPSNDPNLAVAPASQEATAANDLNFALNESTIASFGKKHAPHRMASTPFHKSGVLMPSFSNRGVTPWAKETLPAEDTSDEEEEVLAKPLEDAEKETSAPNGLETEVPAVNDDVPEEPKPAEQSSCKKPIPRRSTGHNLMEERRLSNITETSREIYSTSSSSSEASRQRSRFNSIGSNSHCASTTTGNMHAISEIIGVTFASSAGTPAMVRSELSHHALKTTSTVSTTKVVSSVTSLHNSLINNDEVLPNVLEKSFVRTADEVDCCNVEEDCEKTGYGFKFESLPGSVNPFDPAVQNQLLLRTSRNFNAFPNFHPETTEPMPAIRTNELLELGGEDLFVQSLLGEGAFASAFRVLSIDDTVERPSMCLKVQKPACLWEFYICEEMRRRSKRVKLPVNAINNEEPGVMLIHDGFFFSNGSILVYPYRKFGTLLSLVNSYKSRNEKIDEMIVVYLTIELLYVIETLHLMELIHADLKPDNILLKDVPPSYDSSNLPADSKSLMRNQVCQSIQVIDFGRAIDMKLMKSGKSHDISFQGGVDTECFQCPEMMDKKSWNYQTDYFGVVATVHVLLFREYMKLYKQKGQWRSNHSFRRKTANESLWKTFYTTFLNIPDCSKQHRPDIGSFRRQFEEYLFNYLCNSDNLASWNDSIMTMQRVLSNDC